MNHAQQNAILSRFSWTTDGKVRVRATHRSEALLKLAGIAEPVALEYYNLPVKRDVKGFLVLDMEAAGKRRPVGDSDEDLFEAGGLFAHDLKPGEHQPCDPRRERVVFDGAGNAAAWVTYDDSPRVEADSKRLETEPEMMALKEIPATRTFEIATGPHSKIRVLVLGFEDEALPSPNERERWMPRKTTDTEVHAAVSALHMSRRLADYEKI